MQFVAVSAAFAFGAGMMALLSKRVLSRAREQDELVHLVPRHELMADSREDLLIAPMTFVQLEPLLRELQDSIMAADYNKFRDLIAGTGARHPDAMILDRGLTPLLLAAYMPVRSEKHDRSLRDIMAVLLQRGALITQREDLSGATVMHLLAYQPLRCSVIHRVQFLLNLLEDYRDGPGPEAPLPGLMFDPVLNGASAVGGGGDGCSIAVHLLGMRCYQGKLPEDISPAGDKRARLQERRHMLPPGLQDAGNEQAGAACN